MLYNNVKYDDDILFRYGMVLSSSTYRNATIAQFET